MTCCNKLYLGETECKATFNPFKGIEIIPIGNNKVKLVTVMENGQKNPITHYDNLSIIVEGERIECNRIDENIFKTDKSLNIDNEILHRRTKD